MTDAELKTLYEKLYFEESDARDRIHARLQLPLTLIIAIIGALAFLLQNLVPVATPGGYLFVFMLTVTSAFLIIAIIFFIRAHYNHEYLFVPDSAETAKYRLLLEETYQQRPDAGALIASAMEKFIVGYFIEYAAHNTRVNDRRAAYIHKCTEAIIAAVMALSAAFLVFYFSDLDKSKSKAPTDVIIKQPVDIRMEK